MGIGGSKAVHSLLRQKRPSEAGICGGVVTLTATARAFGRRIPLFMQQWSRPAITPSPRLRWKTTANDQEHGRIRPEQWKNE
jgi:hypothetical protein